MKKLLIILLILSNNVFSIEFRSMYLYDNLRIVISDIPCKFEKGNRASAQRLDKMFIPGCWYKMKEYPELIHIDWHNGDWSELPYEKFEKVTK